ncbi:predicted protein [Micromonas commoda]|uniref:Uncharacterized protein n=1 Tax=Micromonas commoda (strain RCC299 / NOUM17 / CCMP2709) TaxID=296587 RepID=C1EA30_MICCC|nr:predicted protein [Micromonas commoda]ACO64786.1 predicted protein [Micromonas commoda]|eukprot:XP_002503528.1 predicted protein [Micromonas commoda]
MTNELIPIRSLHDVRARCFGVRRIAHVVEQRKSRLTGSGGCRRRERKLPELRRQLLFCHVRATNADCIPALLPRRSNIRCTRSSSCRRRCRTISANFTRLFICNDQIPNASVEFIFEKKKQSMKFTHSKPKSTR